MRKKKLGYYCLECGTLNPYKGKAFTNTYCNNQCQANHTKRKWFEDNEEDFLEGKLKARSCFKKFVLKRDGNKCSICEQEPFHNGKPLTMIIDHIDGDASNNSPENFRLVCPNCDSQLPTFKARNIGNGRATKGMDWYSRI